VTGDQARTINNEVQIVKNRKAALNGICLAVLLIALLAGIGVYVARIKTGDTQMCASHCKKCWRARKLTKRPLLIDFVAIAAHPLLMDNCAQKCGQDLSRNNLIQFAKVGRVAAQGIDANENARKRSCGTKLLNGNGVYS
jgi:hypothetical protein